MNRKCPGCNGKLADWEAFACETCFKLYDTRRLEGYQNVYGQSKPFVRSEASLSVLALTQSDREFLAQIGVSA